MVTITNPVSVTRGDVKSLVSNCFSLTNAIRQSCFHLQRSIFVVEGMKYLHFAVQEVMAQARLFARKLLSIDLKLSTDWRLLRKEIRAKVKQPTSGIH